MSKRLVFFGNERIATGVTTKAPTFQALIDEGYEIAALVLAQKDASPSRKSREPEIVDIAKEHDIPIIKPKKLSEAKDDLSKLDAEAGILVAFGKIIPENIIKLFPRGIINIHPSLLPFHRGSLPIESVILNGDEKTGVSVMQLVQQTDAGPLYAQESVDLSDDETKQALADKLLKVGKDLLIENLPAILDGSLEPQAQDETKATYDERLQKEDSTLNFTDETATGLARQVRAYQKWPRSRAIIGTSEVIITEAHAEEFNGTPVTL